MKFSMIFEAQMADTSVENEHAVLEDCVEQAIAGEAAGFDRVWAVEHHNLKWYAHMSAPEIFLTWVAARTTRIRIGHGVVCMPFGYNHPLRVAERIATLERSAEDYRSKNSGYLAQQRENVNTARALSRELGEALEARFEKERAAARALGASSFPTLLVEAEERVATVVRGYDSAEVIAPRIDAVLASAGS